MRVKNTLHVRNATKVKSCCVLEHNRKNISQQSPFASAPADIMFLSGMSMYLVFNTYAGDPFYSSYDLPGDISSVTVIAINCNGQQVKVSTCTLG